MGDFGIVGVTVLLLLLGGTGQSFLDLKRFPDIFLLHAMGCWHELGCFQEVGGCSLKYLPVKSFDLPNQVGLWKLCCRWSHCCVVGFRFFHDFYLVFLKSFFLFSVVLVSFLIWGLVIGWAGFNWSDWGWSFGINFPSRSR